MQPADGRVVASLLDWVSIFEPTKIVHCHALILGTPVEALPSKRQSSVLPPSMMTQASAPREADVTLNDAVGSGGVTVRVAFCVVPPDAALIVTGVDVLTDDVVIENVALVAPADTVTVAGTVAAALLLESVTTALLAGAAADNVTVP